MYLKECKNFQSFDSTYVCREANNAVDWMGIYVVNHMGSMPWTTLFLLNFSIFYLLILTDVFILVWFNKSDLPRKRK